MKKYLLHMDFAQTIQASMVESAPTWWSDADRAHLRCLIRLNVEFFYFLHEEDTDDPSELRFLGESVFSGTESLCFIAMTFRMMSGDTSNQFAQAVTSTQIVKEQFISAYENFLAEPAFDKRCRFLLDLFRLQVVFVGLTYC